MNGRFDIFRSHDALIASIESDPQSQDNLSSIILDSLDALVVVVEPDGRIVFFNRACQDFTGKSFDEVKGKVLWDSLLSDSYRPIAEHVFSRISPQRIPDSLEIPWYSKSGESRMLSWSISLITDDVGTVRYIICCGNDVTERQCADHCIKTVNECLLELGLDHGENLRIITDSAKKTLDAYLSSYCHMTGNSLTILECTLDTSGLDTSGNPEGHVATKIISANNDGCIVLQNLQDSPFVHTDPCIMAMGIHTCVGHVVRRHSEPVGALCVAFKQHREFYACELQALGALAAALGREEEKQHARTELQLSENKYHELAEFLPEIIFEIDISGRLTFVNRNAFTVFGYTRKDFDDGINALELIAPEDRERAMGNIRHRMTSDPEEQIGYNEYTMLRKDGSDLPGLIASRPIVQNGHVVGLRGIIVDITDRKKMEEALRNSEELFASIFHTSPIPIALSTWDEGRIVKVNEAFEKLVNYSSDELIGRTSLELGLWADHSQREKCFESLGPTNILRSQEIQIACRDGTIKTCMLDAGSIEIDGKPYVVSMITDITGLRNVEEQLKQKNRELQSALAIKGEFLSMVSHELRTPLVPIMGYSELILNGSFGDVPDDLRRPLDTIHNRAESLRDLIEDLLQICRLEKRTMAVNMEPILVCNFIADLITSYRDLDSGKAISIEQRGDDFTVEADPARLIQVLQNIIDNAIKYSGDKVGITIRTELANGRGLIKVSDDGMGIAENKIPYIFNRFYQAEPIDTRSHDGTGLGLAISKELVELMGGSISVKSKIGEGSVFTISLPVTQAIDFENRDDDESRDSMASPEAMPDELSDSASGNKTVLIIDDDTFTIRLVELMLGERYNVISATSGDKGLEITRTNRVDLILLDWMMPGTDGLSLMIALKSDENLSNIPVIFLSGKAEQEAIDRAILAGASDFITKPFKRDDLLERVADILSVKKQ